MVPVARQVWRAFCRPGRIFIACRRDRGTSFIDGRDIVPVDKAQKMALAQCRGTNSVEARK